MDFSIFCTKIIKIHWKRFCSKFITERAHKKIINLIDSYTCLINLTFGKEAERKLYVTKMLKLFFIDFCYNISQYGFSMLNVDRLLCQGILSYPLSLKKIH